MYIPGLDPGMTSDCQNQTLRELKRWILRDMQKSRSDQNDESAAADTQSDHQITIIITHHTGLS
jgi:hypothetical protein